MSQCLGDVRGARAARSRLPLAADPGGQLIGSGVVRGQIGDRVDGPGAPSSLLPGARGDRVGSAGDLDGLAGVRKLDPRSDRDHLEHADLPASVAGLGVAMAFSDLPPRQFGELAAQPGLVSFTVNTQCAPRACRSATCSRWVYNASAVITTPARGRARTRTRRQRVAAAQRLLSATLPTP